MYMQCLEGTPFYIKHLVNQIVLAVLNTSNLFSSVSPSSSFVMIMLESVHNNLTVKLKSGTFALMS